MSWTAYLQGKWNKVYLVLEMLAAGCTVKEIIKSYPSLNEEMIKEALKL